MRRDVAFRVFRFAFPCCEKRQHCLYHAHRRAAPLQCAKADPYTSDRTETVMKFFARFFSNHRSDNVATALERQRLSRTMPGQTGAMAASRLGSFIG